MENRDKLCSDDKDDRSNNNSENENEIKKNNCPTKEGTARKTVMPRSKKILENITVSSNGKVNKHGNDRTKSQCLVKKVVHQFSPKKIVKTKSRSNKSLSHDTSQVLNNCK